MDIYLLDSNILKLFHYKDIHIRIALVNNIHGKLKKKWCTIIFASITHDMPIEARYFHVTGIDKSLIRIIALLPLFTFTEQRIA